MNEQMNPKVAELLAVIVSTFAARSTVESSVYNELLVYECMGEEVGFHLKNQKITEGGSSFTQYCKHVESYVANLQMKIDECGNQNSPNVASLVDLEKELSAIKGTKIWEVINKTQKKSIQLDDNSSQVDKRISPVDPLFAKLLFLVGIKPRPTPKDRVFWDAFISIYEITDLDKAIDNRESFVLNCGSSSSANEKFKRGLLKEWRQSCKTPQVWRLLQLRPDYFVEIDRQIFARLNGRRDRLR